MIIDFLRVKNSTSEIHILIFKWKAHAKAKQKKKIPPHNHTHLRSPTNDQYFHLLPSLIIILSVSHIIV